MTQFHCLIRLIQIFLDSLNELIERNDCDDLKMLANLHGDICKLTKQINDAFSEQLLLYLALFFIEALNVLHLAVTNNDQPKTAATAIISFWIIFLFFDLIFIFIVCRHTTESVCCLY